MVHLLYVNYHYSWELSNGNGCASALSKDVSLLVTFSCVCSSHGAFCDAEFGMTTQQKVGIQFEGKQPFKITVSKDAHIDDLKVKAIEDSKQSTIFPSDVEVKKEDTILNPSNSVISEMDDGWGRNAKNPFVLHIITEGMCNLSNKDIY